VNTPWYPSHAKKKLLHGKKWEKIVIQQRQKWGILAEQIEFGNSVADALANMGVALSPVQEFPAAPAVQLWEPVVNVPMFPSDVRRFVKGQYISAAQDVKEHITGRLWQQVDINWHVSALATVHNGQHYSHLQSFALKARTFNLPVKTRMHVIGPKDPSRPKTDFSDNLCEICRLMCSQEVPETQQHLLLQEPLYKPQHVQLWLKIQSFLKAKFYQAGSPDSFAFVPCWFIENEPEVLAHLGHPEMQELQSQVESFDKMAGMLGLCPVALPQLLHKLGLTSELSAEVAETCCQCILEYSHKLYKESRKLTKSIQDFFTEPPE